MKQSESPQDIWWDYQILDEIAKDEHVSQRDLAQRVGMALGRTNQVVKRLIRKGLVKTRQINAKRVAYYLTPQGFSEKIQLVVKYAQLTINLFSCVREMINSQLDELIVAQNIQTAAIVGTGELAEAVFLSIQEKSLTLKKVYDRNPSRDRWLGFPVHNLEAVSGEPVDVVMVTDMNDLGDDMEKIVKIGRVVVEVRELLSEQLSLFAGRINEEDPYRRRVG